MLLVHRVLSQALQQAVRWQMLGKNPADAVEPPRPRKYNPPVLTPEQVDRLISVTEDNPLRTLVRLAIMTGLRRGELLGLRWQDLDLESGVLRVFQSAQWISGQGWSFREPKTRSSRRSVALGRTIIAELTEHRKRQLEQRLKLGSVYADLDLVFSTALGTPIDPSNLRREWERIRRAADLPSLRFHDLRHVHASLMLLRGVHPKVVAERLGHADVGITMNTYSHILPNLQEEAAADLDQLLSAGEGSTRSTG